MSAGASLLASGPSLLASQIEAAETSLACRLEGRVCAVAGLTIEVSDLPMPVGGLCRVLSGGIGGAGIPAEVIGFHGDRTLLMPLAAAAGVTPGDRVESVTSVARVWCSRSLLGRVVDGMGEPIDGGGPLAVGVPRRIDGRSVAPLSRASVREPISTSVRAIDALHTCGLGQRMGIFSGPGVGKSTLMAQIATHTSADVSVVALVGERGREVHEFVTHTMGPAGMARTVVVAATGDEPPLLRVRAARVAATIAEYFRDQGLHVLLLVDSLTRMAQAQRQIGLAAREPPATKGFPPSVFSMIPELLERAGRTPTGSVTGFYTVLVEGDDFNEPIPDAVKGVTDGHLLLSRRLASRGHYPAIDVLQSISRVRGDVTEPAHGAMARKVLALTAVWEDIEDLVNIGAHVPGANVEYDLAVMARPRIVQFLRQSDGDVRSLDVERSRAELAELCAWIDSAERLVRANAAKGRAAK